jgi:hypothetical protein
MRVSTLSGVVIAGGIADIALDSGAAWTNVDVSSAVAAAYTIAPTRTARFIDFMVAPQRDAGRIRRQTLVLSHSATLARTAGLVVRKTT